jgi:hypothetical protein
VALLACLPWQARASGNPDGSILIPSFSANSVLQMGHDIQQAQLDEPGIQGIGVTVSSPDEGSYDVGLVLPLGDWVSLGGDLTGGSSGVLYSYNYLGNTWSSKYVNTLSSQGAALTLYTQGFVEAPDDPWEFAGSPDGLYYFPILTVSIQANSTDEKFQETYLNSSEIYRSSDETDSNSFQGYGLRLPLPPGLEIYGSYSKEGQYTVVVTDPVSSSHSGAGVGSSWSVGAHKFLNMDGGDTNRSWNPDGKQYAMKLALNYGESWAGNVRENHGYSSTLAWVITSYATLLVGAGVSIADLVPYTTNAFLTVSDNQVSNFTLNANLGLKLYIPNTIPVRPWKASQAPPPREKPKAKAEDNSLSHGGGELLDIVPRLPQDRIPKY